MYARGAGGKNKEAMNRQLQGKRDIYFMAGEYYEEISQLPAFTIKEKNWGEMTSVYRRL